MMKRSHLVLPVVWTVDCRREVVTAQTLRK